MAHRVVVDCDDVMLAIANRDRTTLTGTQETHLHAHLADCDSCRVLEGEVDDCWSWVTHESNEVAMPVVERGRFELGATIAAGGMGRITQASDRRLGREVAIKEVLEPRLRARFDREVRITASLQHPAIVPIYEAGTWPDGAAFYTMRLVPGGTLADAIARTRTHAERLALIPHVLAVTDALAYAHSRRIIHRDLKPGNVLVGEFGETVVIDWGLAKELDDDRDEALGIAQPAASGLTRAGSVLGTPGFMAPEQAAATHEAVDERADVYALGAILYTVLAGSPPHHDELPHDNGDLVLELSLLKPPTPVAARAPELPRDLSAIVERAMARRPEDRYPSAREMAEELRRFAAGKLVATHDYSLRELLGRWLRRHRTAVAVGAIMLVALAVVAVLAFVNIGRSRDAEQRARVAAEHGFASSERSVASLLEEQGRYEVLEGDPRRGLVYLAEAVQRGRDGVAIRQLLATATRNLDLLEHSRAFPGGVITVGFARAGELVVVEAEPRITVWKGGKQLRTIAIEDAPHAATLSDDGAYVAIVGAAPAITVWDTGLGTRLWRLEDPRYSQAQVAIDPARRVLAIITHGEDDLPRRLEVRALATGALLARLPLGPKDVLAVAFGAGKLAACDEDGSIGIWDTTKFALLAKLASTARPRRLAFAGADRVVAAGDGAELWVLGEPARPRELPGHLGAVTALAVDDRGWFATGDGGGGVRLWSPDGEPRGESQVVQDMVHRLAFAPGGLLVGGGQEPRAYVWDARSLGVVHAFEAHDEWEGELFAPEPGGSRLVTASFAENVVRVWKLPRPNRIAQVAARATALAPDRWLVATATGTTVHRLDTGAVVRELPRVRSAEAKVAHLQVSRDGRRAVLQGPDAVFVFDPASDHVLALAIDGIPRLAAHGRHLLDVGDPIRVLDTTTGAVVRTLALPEPTWAGAISPDGALLALERGDDVTQVRVATGQQLAVTPLGDPDHHLYTEVAVDPTGRKLVVSSNDRFASVVEAGSGKLLGKLASTRPIAISAFSPDGNSILTWGEGNTVQLWDLRDLELKGAVDRAAFAAFAFSADGQRFATGSEAGLIQVYETRSVQLIARMQVPRRTVTHVEFSADGTRLVVRSQAGVATLLDVALDRRSPTELAALAARHTRWKLRDGALVPP